MEEISKFITSIGFPCTIAILMWWNNRQIVTILEKHYETLFTWMEKRITVWEGKNDENEGN